MEISFFTLTKLSNISLRMILNKLNNLTSHLIWGDSEFFLESITEVL
ncbi:hypothetical protein PMI13_03262 [Chryseobacterium populi]|uniref:Uncharacterized protein n=1 Tax=Chryseobacterium populi TaxID=1144316 RepID=J3CDH6_9FLAO|nr:hypothetical protein PMI13_03262 [Chryseobacterium populi]